MIESRRIALNVAATYGRSLVALACGLITGRWVLMSLGVVDYGILGVVSGLVAFVTFFNNVLSGAVARFYSLSVGKGELAECRRWFSVAVSLHSVLPLVLIAVGYPIGAWAVAYGLTIPADRIGAALWVWRLTCVGAFFAMVSVPFQAMFVAKQRFGEISLYSALISIAQVGVLGYMVTHEGPWLVPLAVWTCLSVVVPNVLVMIRAVWLFAECRMARRHLWNKTDMVELGAFVGWMTLGGFGLVLRDSGMAVLVNLLFGPARNAALAVANTASGHAASLTASVQQVFVPAIATTYGSGDSETLARLSGTASRFCGLCLLPFVLPLMLEAEEVLTLWLKAPPEGASTLCVLILVSIFIDRVGCGLWAGIEASGHVVIWQVGCCLVKVLGLTFAGGLYVLGLGLESIGVALILIAAAECVLHLILSRIYLGFSILRLMREVYIPLVAVIVVAVAAGFLPRFTMSASLLRVAVTTLVANAVLLPLAWRLVLEGDERQRACSWILRSFNCRRGEVGA